MRKPIPRGGLEDLRLKLQSHCPGGESEMPCAMDTVAINDEGSGASQLLSLTVRFSGKDAKGFFTEDKNSGAWKALK